MAMWPTMSEYQEAVQTPKVCFADGHLKAGAPVLNKLGLPKPISGQFASVYEIEGGGSRWAIKCFLRNIPDLHSRYAKIAKHLGSIDLPYFVTFDYLQKGIRVRGDFYPIVKMEWDTGVALNNYIEANLSNPAVLQKLEQDWLKLLEDLEGAKLAHGDLQHGNVLVRDDGALRLIDYDGMWVPKLKGQGSHETGHPNFQSPLRTGKDFDETTDYFAAAVIRIAIRAVARNPQLWQKYDNGDNLLFRISDFLQPASAALFADLRALGDDEIGLMLDGLLAECAGQVKRGASRFFKPKKVDNTAAPAPAAAPVAAAPAPPPAPVAAPPPPPPRAAPPPPPRPAPVARPAPRPPPPPPPPPPKPTGPGSWIADHVEGDASMPVAPAARTVAPPRPVARPAPAPAPPPRAAPMPPVVKVAAPAPAPAPAAAPAPARVAKPAGSGPSVFARLLGHFRMLLHLLLLATTGWILTTELLTTLGVDRNRASAIFMAGFGLAVVLGLISTFSLFAGRVIHRPTSSLFFSQVILLVLLSVFSQLIINGWPSWAGDDPLQGPLMVTMLSGSVVALGVEALCSRVGVVTRWGLPWRN